MIRYIYGIALSLLLLVPTACTTEGFEETVSSDALITAVTLGKLTHYATTTTAAGADSSYAVTLTGALYPLTIDHYKGRVYNPDSLPATTDLRKVVFESFNATGGITLKTLSGADTLFSLKDSLDFSVPRAFVVHASNQQSKRNYTVELRKHKQEAEATTWTQLAPMASLPADAQLRRAWVIGERLYVFAEHNTKPLLLTAADDASAWTNTPIDHDGIDLSSVQSVQGKFVALANNALIASTNGTNWRVLNDQLPAQPRQLLSDNQQRLILLTANGIYSSSDEGKTWEANATDDSDALPFEKSALTGIASNSDTRAQQLLLVGLRGESVAVWTQHLRADDPQMPAWVSLTNSNGLQTVIPKLKQFQLLPYDSGALLVGETSDGQVSGIYSTANNGLNWTADKLTLPAYAKSNSSVSAVGGKHYLYLFFGGSGEVWRGRLNRLGWNAIEGAFTN